MSTAASGYAERPRPQIPQAGAAPERIYVYGVPVIGYLSLAALAPRAFGKFFLR